MPIRVVVGQMVSGDDFFDREELLKSIWSRLPGQSIELVAPRRFGKTSIMQRLLAAPQNGCRVVFIDCEAFRFPNDFVQELTDAVVLDDPISKTVHGAGHVLDFVRELVERFRGIRIGPDGLGLDLSDPGSASWSASVQRLLSAARHHEAPTIVVLDEFSMMLENLIRRSRVPEGQVVNLLLWFRRLRQQQGQDRVLSFVVGGSIGLDYWLRRLKASATMNDLQRMEVPPFDEPTARTFVTALVESERLTCGAGVVDALLAEVAPAVPYWIQALVWELFQTSDPSRRIAAADVGRAYRERIIGIAGRHYFQPFQERIDRYDESSVPGALRVLTYLAEDQSVEGVSTETLAVVFFQASGLDSREAFDAVMADLQSDFYIRYEGATERYVFAHKVLKDWWLRWHSSGGEARS